MPESMGSVDGRQADGIHNLTLEEAPVPAPKATEVFVKVHAVSLQVRASKW